MRVPDHKIRELELRIFHDGKLDYILVETQLIRDILEELKELKQEIDNYENHIYMSGDPDQY